MIKCLGCNISLPREFADSSMNEVPCPSCRATERHINRLAEFGLEMKIRIKDRFKVPGRKRALLERLGGDDYFKTGKRWVRKLRLIDRQNDRYLEIVFDPKTSEVLHFCEEPLSEHINHGTAASPNT